MKCDETKCEADVENGGSSTWSVDLNSFSHLDKGPHEQNCLNSRDDHKDWYEGGGHVIFKADNSVPKVVKQQGRTLLASFFQRNSLDPQLSFLV